MLTHILPGKDSGSLEITVAGTTNFTVPMGVYELTVDYACAGGGGAGSGTHINGNGAGGGGGGGGYRSGDTIAVVPFESLSFVVGAAGRGGCSDAKCDSTCVGTCARAPWPAASGESGGDTYIQRLGVDLLRVYGGSGGVGGTSGAGGGGGVGGSGGPGGTSGGNGTAGQGAGNDLYGGNGGGSRGGPGALAAVPSWPTPCHGVTAINQGAGGSGGGVANDSSGIPDSYGGAGAVGGLKVSW